MRKILMFGAIAVTGLACTVAPALAQTQAPYGQPGSSMQQPGMSTPQPGTSTQQPGMSTPQHQPGTSRSMEPNVIASRYTAQVTGEVTNVDRQSGKLTLKTVDGDVNATFPPVAVQNVKQGDRVTLAIGLLERHMPSASPSMSSPSTSPSTSPGTRTPPYTR